MGQNFQYRGSSGQVGSFITSGKPWLKRGLFASGSASGSATEEIVTFPSVTKSILLVNEQNNNSAFVLRLSFDSVAEPGVYDASDGTGASIPLVPGEAITLDVKCRTVYISSDTIPTADSYYILVGELSNVSEEHPLSGSGINI